MSRDYSYLIKTLSSWNFEIDDNKISQLDKFYEMLLEKNKNKKK